MLLGLIGAFVITQVLRLCTGFPMGLPKEAPEPPQGPVGAEEPLLPIELE